jgi:hypothetical protein
MGQHRPGAEIDLGGFAGGEVRRTVASGGVSRFSVRASGAPPSSCRCSRVRASGGVNDDAGDALVEPGGDSVAQRFQTGNGGAGPLWRRQCVGDGRVVGQRPSRLVPASPVRRPGPQAAAVRRPISRSWQCRGRSRPDASASGPVGSGAFRSSFCSSPPAKKPPRVPMPIEIRNARCLLLQRRWLHYADPRLAPICRSRTGSITPIRHWLLYADHKWIQYAGR